MRHNSKAAAAQISVPDIARPEGLKIVTTDNETAGARRSRRFNFHTPAVSNYVPVSRPTLPIWTWNLDFWTLEFPIVPMRKHRQRLGLRQPSAAFTMTCVAFCHSNLSPFVTYCRLLSCLAAFCHLFQNIFLFRPFRTLHSALETFATPNSGIVREIQTRWSVRKDPSPSSHCPCGSTFARHQIRTIMIVKRFTHFTPVIPRFHALLRDISPKNISRPFHA
jgi:hypothetical protein